MTQEHKVIIAPGLDGRIDKIKWLTKNWPEKYGLQPIMVPIIWKDGESFTPKLKQITDLIDRFAKNGDKISLIGCSAGGSAVFNAFMVRKTKIYRVVNNGGFLRPGHRTGYRSLATRTALSPAFKQSVLNFAALESNLTPADKAKILTVRPIWDELVPPETVYINGATNKVIPMVEHILGLGLALIRFDPIIKFLKTSAYSESLSD